MANASVSFHHPLITHDLTISVNPDEIIWQYGLNTAVYPTYGGEVVQILSVYFDDMTVIGTVSTYDEAERIYSWFITYMQYATQGRDNPSFDQHPVDFYYPERQWHFQIWPRSLPGFRYGRDVVAPTWTLQAAVKEPDATFADQIKDYAAFNAANSGKFDTFGKATANFGSTGDLENNPWASPDANPALKGKTLSAYYTQEAQRITDSYTHFVDSYTAGDISSLPQFPNISKPPALPTAPSSNGKTAKKSKVKK